MAPQRQTRRYPPGEDKRKARRECGKESKVQFAEWRESSVQQSRIVPLADEQSSGNSCLAAITAVIVSFAVQCTIRFSVY